MWHRILGPCMFWCQHMRFFDGQVSTCQNISSSVSSEVSKSFCVCFGVRIVFVSVSVPSCFWSKALLCLFWCQNYILFVCSGVKSVLCLFRCQTYFLCLFGCRNKGCGCDPFGAKRPSSCGSLKTIYI